MTLKRNLKRAADVPLSIVGLTLERAKCAYNSDGIRLEGKNLPFMSDQKFIDAYSRGMNSGHSIGRAKGSDTNIGVEYRAYVECWAASQGLAKDGDFVFCGVNTGVFPLTICQYLDINTTDKKIWLFDTYNGVPESQMDEREVKYHGRWAKAYFDCYDIAVANFAPYPNAHLVRGTIPETLTDAQIDKVSYLSIDMNIALPEVAALEFFWPKMSSGSVVILDDFGFVGHEPQLEAMGAVAQNFGVSILSLPTGQGMILKP